MTSKASIGSSFDDFLEETGVKEEVHALALSELQTARRGSHWNYRIVQRRSDGSFGLHEVYYHADGRPRAMTEQAVGFVADDGEGAAGIVSGLERALRDARERPVLIESEAFPDERQEKNG